MSVAYTASRRPSRECLCHQGCMHYLQVTLVSSDNQSFQVPEQVAKMSNTIKDTLEGETRTSYLAT